MANDLVIGNLQAKLKVDSAEFESGIRKGKQRLDELIQGMTAAGKSASDSSRLINGMGSAGRDAAAAVAALQRPLDSVALGMSAAGQAATDSGKLIAGMSASGRAELEKLETAAKNAGSAMSLTDRAAGLLKSSFGQFTAANLAANAISAITSKVGDLIALGGRLPAIEGSFKSLADGIGENSSDMLQSMDSAARGLVSDLDLMQSANKAMLLGLPVTSKEMGELTKAAVTLGRAMGQDATKSVDDLITALGRSSPMILDNLGITVKVEEANEHYAASLGKTADQLTESEKKMAFYKEAMEKARAKTQELGDQTLTLTEIMAVGWTKVGNVITRTASDINVGIGNAVSSGKNLAAFITDLISYGPAIATLNASLRDEIANSKRRTEDIELPLEKVVSLSDQYAERVAKLQAASAALSEEDRTRIIRLHELGDETAAIAKFLHLEENAVQGTIEAHEKAADAAKKHSDELNKLNAEIAQFTTDQYRQSQALMNGGVTGGVRSSGPDLGLAWIDQFEKLAAESSVLNNSLETTNDELDRLREGFDFAQALSQSNREIDALIDGLKRAQPEASGLGHAFGGMFDGIQSGFKSLVEGMTGKNGIAGFMNNLGKGIVDGFGKILSGGLASVIEMGVNLAVQGIAKIGNLIGGLFQSEETKKVNKPRDEFQNQFGGFDGLARELTDALVALGEEDAGDKASELLRTMNSADTEAKWKAAERAISDVFGRSGRDIQTFHTGGMINGAGWNEVNIRALPGESVLNRSATGMLGRSGVDALNAGMLPGRAGSDPQLRAAIYQMNRTQRDLPRQIGVQIRDALAGV